MSLTKEEAEALISAAVERVVRRLPLPVSVTTVEAAEMLDVSVSTIQRMKPPRLGTKIPYEWVARQLSK